MGSTDDLSMQQIAEEWGVEEANLSLLDEAIDILDGLGVSYHIWTREQSEAFETLQAFQEGDNGFFVPIQLYVPVEAAQSQSEAAEVISAALTSLGIHHKVAL